MFNPFIPTVPTCAVRETCAVRGAPIMPRDAVSRTANVERTGRHKWVNMLGAVTRCVGYWLIAKCSNKQDLHILEASFFKS